MRKTAILYNGKPIKKKYIVYTNSNIKQEQTLLFLGKHIQNVVGSNMLFVYRVTVLHVLLLASIYSYIAISAYCSLMNILRSLTLPHD